MTFAFYIISALMLVSAVMAVIMRNLIHCALSAAVTFLSVAALFFLLKAEFIGAIQIFIYVGAVATLILFTIMLTRNLFSKGYYVGQKRQWSYGFSASVSVLVMLVVSVLTQTNLPEIVARKPNVDVAALGKDMLTTYLLPFEVASLLLTAAVIGGVVIALGKQKEPS